MRCDLTSNGSFLLPERKGKVNLVYKTYDELPLFIDVKTVSSVLGISRSGAYELMHEKSFPTLKIGARMVVPKEKFIKWVNDNVGG